MKNRLFYFATCVALALSSVSCSSDDDGEEDIDIPVVGKIAVSGAYNVYSHGSQGWIEADKIGIYVLSDGKPQENLPYFKEKWGSTGRKEPLPGRFGSF